MRHATHKLTTLAQALGILALGVALLLVLHHFGMLNRWVVLSMLAGAVNGIIRDASKKISNGH